MMKVPTVETSRFVSPLSSYRMRSESISPSPLQGEGRSEGKTFMHRQTNEIPRSLPPLIPPGRGEGSSSESKLGALREAAGKAVGSAFYGTMFQMMRESKFKTRIGNGGRGEEVFSAQLHEVLAERLGESKQSNLSDVLYRRLEKQQRLIDASTSRRSGE